MLKKDQSKLKAFTLVELLIVIFVVGVIATSVKYVNFNEINNRKRAEVFTNNVSRVFETTRNNALLGRSVLTQNPEAWRVSVDLSNSWTFVTDYLSWTTWENFDDSDFNFQVETPSFINSINCDVSWDVISGSWVLVFRWRDLTFSWACDINDKIMRIGTNYSAFTWEIIINAVSWVIETID